MQNFIDFLIRHWQLSLTFGVIAGYWVFSEVSASKRGKKILPSQLVYLMNRENAVVIDMREIQDYEQGHILGSLCMPQNALNPNKLKKYQAKPIILVSPDGLTPEKVLQTFAAEGFENVLSLKNGLQSWRQAGLPLEKGSAKNSEKIPQKKKGIK